MFPASIWSSLCRSMFWLLFILFVLDSSVAVFAQPLLSVLRTVYVIGRISSELTSGQTFFRSTMWISSVTGNSKILGTNFRHATVPVFTRCHRLYRQLLVVYLYTETLSGSKRTDHDLMCGSCRYLIAVTV